MIISCSKTVEPRDAWWSIAICLLPETSRSQGTDEAYKGRMSRAICASVGYNVALFYRMTMSD
jgi:hypothetical protein